jgi:hypothetical protein
MTRKREIRFRHQAQVMKMILTETKIVKPIDSI